MSVVAMFWYICEHLTLFFRSDLCSDSLKRCTRSKTILKVCFICTLTLSKHK